MSKKIQVGEINGEATETIKLTPEVEINEELIGKENVRMLKNLRKKYPAADLSNYEINVKSKTNE